MVYCAGKLIETWSYFIPSARDLQAFLVFFWNPAWFIPPVKPWKVWSFAKWNQTLNEVRASPVRYITRVETGTNMNFGQRKLAGSKNIILNTCGETFNVVSKAHWRRDNLISCRNEIKITWVRIQMDYFVFVEFTKVLGLMKKRSKNISIVKVMY